MDDSEGGAGETRPLASSSSTKLQLSLSDSSMAPASNKLRCSWCKSRAVLYEANVVLNGRETSQITSLRKMSLADFLYLVAGLFLDFLLGMKIRVSEVDLCCDLPALHHSIGW